MDFYVATPGGIFLTSEYLIMIEIARRIDIFLVLKRIPGPLS
jgi:hypothetical protein